MPSLWRLPVIARCCLFELPSLNKDIYEFSSKDAKPLKKRSRVSFSVISAWWLILEGLRAQAKLSPQYFIYFSGDRNKLKRETRQKLLKDLADFLFKHFHKIGEECGYLIPKASKHPL